MVGANPAKIAMLILKINIYLFVITLGANVLMLFPYYMHISQVSNNIAMDVSNRNYTTHDDLSMYVDHLGARMGDTDAVTYSLLTFSQKKITGVVHNKDLDSSTDGAKEAGGATIFSDPLSPVPNSYIVSNSGEDIASVSVTALSGTKKGKSLIGCYKTCTGSFDPINNSSEMIEGMDGINMKNNSILVNRGVPFKVSVKTRYKLSGGAFGFMFHAGLPITVDTVGVTTQYYQYDSE